MMTIRPLPMFLMESVAADVLAQHHSWAGGINPFWDCNTESIKCLEMNNAVNL